MMMFSRGMLRLLQRSWWHAGADGCGAFAIANRSCLHRDRRDQLIGHLRVVPGITISTPAGSSTSRHAVVRR